MTYGKHSDWVIFNDLVVAFFMYMSTVTFLSIPDKMCQFLKILWKVSAVACKNLFSHSFLLDQMT